ncbi:Ger(x)C family spore germination protein [Actinomycetes bacterium NPDC127524]
MSKWHIILISLILSVSGVLCGCGFRDIDKRFFVVSMGVDKSSDPKKPYHVTLKLAIPAAQVAAGKSNSQIISQNADSIPEAIRVMKAKVDKEFDFAHCRVLLFDKKIIGENPKTVLNWFVRRRDIQGISYISIAEPSSKKVLQVNPKSERLPGNSMVFAFDETTNTSTYVLTEILNDFYSKLREKGIDPVLPIIRPAEKSYTIDTAAVYGGTRIKGELDRNETRMLNEMLNTSKRGQINTGRGKEHFFINVNRFSNNIDIITPANQRPYANVYIKVEGYVEESNGKLSTNKELLEHQRKASLDINLRIEELLKHLQRMGADPLGLGLKYGARHGSGQKQENEWKGIYKNLDFHVHSKVKIDGSGTVY